MRTKGRMAAPVAAAVSMAVAVKVQCRWRWLRRCSVDGGGCEGAGDWVWDGDVACMG